MLDPQRLGAVPCGRSELPVGPVGPPAHPWARKAVGRTGHVPRPRSRSVLESERAPPDPVPGSGRWTRHLDAQRLNTRCRRLEGRP